MDSICCRSRLALSVVPAPDLNANDGGPHAWDEGWAFYAGSTEGTDGSGEGFMLHQLATKRCGRLVVRPFESTLHGDGYRVQLTYALIRRQQQWSKGRRYSSASLAMPVQRHPHVTVVECGAYDAEEPRSHCVPRPPSSFMPAAEPSRRH